MERIGGSEVVETSCSDERIHTFGVLLEAMAQLNRTFDRSLREHAGINQSLFEGLLRQAHLDGLSVPGNLPPCGPPGKSDEGQRAEEGGFAR